MFNVGGGEVLVILLVALLVLGPGKLPQAARQIGNVLTQVRQMSTGFQNELKAALDEPTTTRSPAVGAKPIDETPGGDGTEGSTADTATERTADDAPTVPADDESADS